MKKLLYLTKLFGLGLFEIFRMLFLGIFIPICCFSGLIVIVDVLWIDSSLPSPRTLNARERVEAIESVIHTEFEDERWNKMQRSLALLDRSVPEVSAWVRDEREKGRLVYELKTDQYIAAYMPVIRRLIITDAFFEYGTYFQASVLAHEFCHSRQNMICRIKRTIAWLTGRDEHQYVEGPAYEYGDRILHALTKW